MVVSAFSHFLQSIGGNFCYTCIEISVLWLLLPVPEMAACHNSCFLVSNRP